MKTYQPRILAGRALCAGLLAAVLLTLTPSTAAAAGPMLGLGRLLPAVETTSLSEAIAQRWPGAWSLMVRLELVEPPALDPWEDTFWVIPERREWIIVDGVPVVGTEQVDELWHRVTPRQDLYWLRSRYRTTRARLLELNPNLDLTALEQGDDVLVWRRDPEHFAHGTGSPNRGRLRHGEPLPRADKYHIMHRHRAFGTYYTVSEIKRVFDAYALVFPDRQPVLMGDLSFRTGRRIRPHLSHQTGRDVDITYPRFDSPPDRRRFHRIRRSQLDAEATLWLVREFLASGMVEYIFMDRWVQRLLYEEARRHGAPQEWLDAVFEYPGWGGRAVIRRAKGHDDHMHIRFWCQPTDRWCG